MRAAAPPARRARVRPSEPAARSTVIAVAPLPTAVPAAKLRSARAAEAPWPSAATVRVAVRLARRARVRHSATAARSTAGAAALPVTAAPAASLPMEHAR